MKQAATLFTLILLGLFALHFTFGFRLAAEVAYGALALLGAAISVTFLWLWRERATPLALGMAFSWGGTATAAGWWWFARGLDDPAWLRAHPALFACLALFLTGAILHFAVIGRSLQGAWRTPMLVGAALAIVVGVLVSVI